MNKFTLTYDDQNEFLYLKIEGILEIEDLRQMMPSFNKLFEGKKHRHILIEMDEKAQVDANFMTKELRNTYKEFMSHVDADKSAIIGSSPIVRMVSKVAIAVSGKSKVTRFFKTREEALAWLKE